ncbi:MAG TPA: pyridoxal-phosphate dependent enzyme, partial [Rhodospirillales bacterium]|nr:pyridoxal-phosphate dependent enzyme [Rhodospirillales bacterium]
MNGGTTPAAAAEGEAPLPTFAEVLAASRRLHGVARRTPLLSHARLDDRAGGRLLIKPEPLQHTGSFKFRGAYNALRCHAPSAVVAYSSGNHAQGVARAAHLLGIPACIVMPADAPAIKRAATEAWGAEVVTYDRDREEREAIGARIAAERGATLIRPYDDPHVIAGQGTVGLEIARDCLARGLLPDAALFPCGGGGLV